MRTALNDWGTVHRIGTLSSNQNKPPSVTKKEIKINDYKKTVFSFQQISYLLSLWASSNSNSFLCFCSWSRSKSDLWSYSSSGASARNINHVKTVLSFSQCDSGWQTKLRAQKSFLKTRQMVQQRRIMQTINGTLNQCGDQNYRPSLYFLENIFVSK